VPEYLAPGVYVEETSFRSKSIEGVSTSTTGFVGPTRRGPVAHSLTNPADATFEPDTLELITSFGDFQRIYGSLDDLEIGTNYPAHAVRTFFDNGGGRLYVARVYAGAAATAFAESEDLGDGVRFVARNPGAGGRGKITIIPHFVDVTKRNLDRAPEGTTLRTGAKRPAQPAEILGSTELRFTLPQTGRLVVRLDDDDADISIGLTGTPATVTGTVALGDSISLPEGQRVLTVVLNGATQQVTLPAGPTPRERLVNSINNAIAGGFASLTADPNANRLIIGSDIQGTRSSVVVNATGAATALGFEGGALGSGGGDLPDVRNVTIEDLATRVSAATEGRLIVTRESGRLVLRTESAGATASITVQTVDNSVHDELELAEEEDTGEAGADVTFYVKDGKDWLDPDGDALDLEGVGDTEPPSDDGAEFVTITVLAEDADEILKTYEDLGLAPKHPRYVGTVLAPMPTRRSDQLENVFALRAENKTPAQLRAALLISDAARPILLDQGGSGEEPPGKVHYAAALRALEGLEGVSIVAAPGESAYEGHQAIVEALIGHCERRRAYRIAVLDTQNTRSISEAQQERSRIDSTYAAVYYPWVVVDNPLARPGDESIPREIALPPSGFVCGVYARTDVARGVFKAPANEIVRGALRYELDVNFAQQEVLNPLGINCLRSFPGRGNRVWGARTASSDPEWKYVSVRRYFNYLERSIDVGTQWAVFEPNGERLWANVRETLSGFLVNEWRSGALLGSSPKEAFFVRCDRSTMDQNDLDNGRLVCLVGVAVVKPAEFVIFRIGQKTADARN
jgi:phage tail sheath protein FI